jgi:uncharacterized protein (DUF952 family)
MLIYHMCRREEWRAAQEIGLYYGSSQDLADGFIHFSTAETVVESAAKHRAGQAGLLLIAVDPQVLGPALKWEEARGGVKFPHLYGALPLKSVASVRELPLGHDGLHVFPPLERPTH